MSSPTAELLDNAALNVPKAFSVHIHEQRERYRDSRILPFREVISHVWVVDGGGIRGDEVPVTVA